MFNQSGVTKTTYGATRQILANVELQGSVGCVVAQDMGVTVGDKKLVKAGTPIHVDFMNLQTVAAKPDNTDTHMNAVLLHDVDVTKGNANGTALYLGVVNVNRVESDVAALIAGANADTDASSLIVFLKA